MAKDKTLMYVPDWLVCVKETLEVDIRESTLKPTKQKLRRTLSLVDEQQTSIKNLANALSDMLTIPNQVLTGMYVKHVIDDNVYVSHALWGEASICVSSAAYNKLVENGALEQQELIVVVNKGVEVCLAFKSEVDADGVPSVAGVVKRSQALTPGLTYKSATRKDTYLYLGVSRFTGKSLFLSESSPAYELEEGYVVPFEAVSEVPVLTSKLEALKARNFIKAGSAVEVRATLQSSPLKEIVLKDLLAHENFYWGVFNRNESLSVVVDTSEIEIPELVASIIWHHPELKKELSLQKYEHDRTKTYLDNCADFINSLTVNLVTKSQFYQWYLPITLSKSARSLLRTLDNIRITHARRSKEGYNANITRLVIDNAVTVEPFYRAGPNCDVNAARVLHKPEYISGYSSRNKFNFVPLYDLRCMVFELSQGELVSPTSEYLLQSLDSE